MKTIDIDIETRSAANLKKCGSYAYANHESTEILCLCYSIDGEEIETWYPGYPIPSAFTKPFCLVAHNVDFELDFWTAFMVPLGAVEPADFVCTMSLCLERNLPAALSFAAPALGLTIEKDKEGRMLMLKMCKADYEHTDDELDKLVAYCKQDVKVEQAIHARLKKMLDPATFKLDRKINQRGLRADTELAAAILNVVDAERDKLTVELQELTDGEIQTGNQVAKLLVWLRKEGYKATDLQAESVSAILNQPRGVTAKGIRALEIRASYSLGSISKYKSILASADSEGRCRGLFQYCGASQTGRFAGRRIQFQNLPRLFFTDADIELAITLFKSGETDAIKFFFGDVFTAAKQLIRPTFYCNEGMIVSDFSQIEARVVAWVAKQDEITKEFSKAEPKVYEQAAAKIYKVKVDQVTKEQRFIGKVCTLAASYGLGHVMFRERLRLQDIHITTNEAVAAVDGYREANSKIVDLWYSTERAMKLAIGNPGMAVKIGWNMKFESFKVGKNISIKLRLPSDRCLFYHNCKLTDGKHGSKIKFQDGEGGWVETYGGKLVENLTQAIARDILVAAMHRLDDAGYELTGHVHDEVIIEKVTTLDSQKVTGIMRQPIDWAEGLPIDAETNFCHRYTK